jgi:hypothetical protein
MAVTIPKTNASDKRAPPIPFPKVFMFVVLPFDKMMATLWPSLRGCDLQGLMGNAFAVELI